MGRGQKSFQKTLNFEQVERILSSSKSKELKLRELSQLQNGRMKLGTMQAKSIYENYSQRTKTNFMKTIMDRMEPEMKKMFDKLRDEMPSEEREKFDNMSRGECEEFIKSINSMLPDEPEPTTESEVIESSESIPEMKPEELPTLSRDEYNLLNNMLK